MINKKIKNLYVHLLITLNHISVVIIFLTALWIFGDVIGRYFFNQPIPGTTELIKTAIIAIVFLGFPYALYKKAHIRTTVLTQRLSPGYEKWLEIISSIIGITIFSLVCIYGWKAAVKAWAVNEFEGVQLRVPTYPSRFIMVLGSFLLVVQYLINLVKALSTKIGKVNKGEK